MEQVVAMEPDFGLLSRVWCIAELVEAKKLHLPQVAGRGKLVPLLQMRTDVFLITAAILAICQSDGGLTSLLSKINTTQLDLTSL